MFWFQYKAHTRTRSLAHPHSHTICCLSLSAFPSPALLLPWAVLDGAEAQQYFQLAYTPAIGALLPRADLCAHLAITIFQHCHIGCTARTTTKNHYA